MRDHSKHVELSREQAVEGMIDALGASFGWQCPYEGNRAEGAPIDVAGADRAWEDADHAREVERKMVETVPLEAAVGRVLAHSLHSRIDAPNTLTCCMDSIAVHWSDFEQGIPDTSAWVRGVDWEFANTGIAMPQGFDTAIVIENVEVSEDNACVHILAAPSKRYAGTKPAGANMKRGDLLCRAGKVLTPDDIARIASGNRTCAPVVRKPRVAFIPTGNELVAPGSASVETGKNLETNSFVVRGKVEQWGGVFVPFDIVPDNPERIRDAVLLACEVADIVVLNAGSSKGSDDWSVEQMEDMGQIICHQTNHGPGHHSSYAVVESTPIVGISGPSGGASFTLNFYLKPVMKRFLGLPHAPERIPAVLTEAFPAKPSKPKPTQAAGGEERPSVAAPHAVFYGIKFVEAKMSDDGVFRATPVKGHAGSTPTLHANAYYMMPSGPGMEPPEAGDVIWIELR